MLPTNLSAVPCFKIGPNLRFSCARLLPPFRGSLRVLLLLLVTAMARAPALAGPVVTLEAGLAQSAGAQFFVDPTALSCIHDPRAGLLQRDPRNDSHGGPRRGIQGSALARTHFGPDTGAARPRRRFRVADRARGGDGQATERGLRRCGGRGARRTANAPLTVLVRETRPSRDGVVTLALTSPFHFVVMPLWTGAVQFVVVDEPIAP